MSNNFEDRGNVRNKIGLPPKAKRVYGKSTGRNKEGIDAMIEAMPKRDRNDPRPGPSFMYIRMKSGENIHGSVQESDRFTITLTHAVSELEDEALTEEGLNPFVVIYKSDIAYFTTRVLPNGSNYFDTHSEEV